VQFENAHVLCRHHVGAVAIVSIFRLSIVQVVDASGKIASDAWKMVIRE